MLMKFSLKRNTEGFTLIEALVAISILMIAIASPMSLAQKGLSTATQSKDQMIAAFLAQDAVEAVKNIRDQIAVSQTTGDWLTGTVLNDCICNLSSVENCNLDNTVNLIYCTIDTASPTWITSALSISKALIPQIPLKISYTAPDINGLKHFLKYDYVGLNGGEDSKFVRYTTIVKDPSGSNPNEALVKVRVTWNSPQGPQKIDIQDFIYNYSENL